MWQRQVAPAAAGTTVTEDLLQKVFKLQGGKISAEDTEWERKNTCNKGKTTRDLQEGSWSWMGQKTQR